jgi:hypothetical protein
VNRRQREEYGGLSWGSAFFGWPVAGSRYHRKVDRVGR